MRRRARDVTPSKRPGAPGARPAVLPSTDPRAPYLPNPATKLKQAGRKQEAMIAWEKCAEANERTGNDWHAGKHLEQCASLARDLALHDQVVAYAERACAAYVSAGRAQRGAECLGKIARLIDEAAPDEAYDLASRACEMLEDDGKAANARDFYSLAGAIRMRQEKFADAAETMLRFGASCDAANAHASLRKAYLSAVVAQLYAGNGAEAQQLYADVGEIDAFQDSDEQRCAYSLISAYRDADADAVRSAIAASNALTFLDAPFARAARKLPRPGHDLRAVSIAMGGDGGVLAAGERFMDGIGGGGGGDSDLPDDEDLT